MAIPFLRPTPPRLSKLVEELTRIENSGIYTNYGPVNKRFESAITQRIFGGEGGCVTVCNATIGLMMAIRDAVGEPSLSGRRYALMPSFTFAATAHAAIWAGLTPLLCDINPETWLPCEEAEEELLRRYAGEVAVVVPYATFGNNLDLDRYERLSQKHGVPIVIDAAASLGSIDEQDRGFGKGCKSVAVYSMHATKTFATSEGGVIYTADESRLARLRAMGNFGFGEPRTATMAGLNSKLSEIAALLALAKLEGFDAVVERRAELCEIYRSLLPDFEFQKQVGHRVAYQFMPVLLPQNLLRYRDDLIGRLATRGIGAAHYFSPHLADQPYFRERCGFGSLDNTRHIAERALSLPLSDDMTVEEVRLVCSAVIEELRELDLELCRSGQVTPFA